MDEVRDLLLAICFLARAFIEDFGTDHWYQMDGYFDGGTAPWRIRENHKRERGEC